MPSIQSIFRYLAQSSDKKVIAFFCIILLLFQIPCHLSAAVDNLSTNLYQEGLELKKRGEYKEALNTWLSARNILDKSDIDPRIGFSFIELVTEQRLEKYYKAGSLMYYWALSGNTFKEYKKAIENEVKRIKPLLSEATSKKWNELVDNDNPQILTEIQKFWGQLDPTINTIHNERLVEHWERIHYAKTNFTENNKLIYPSDERGSIFIKYGKPERVKSGSFRFNTLRIQSWAHDMALLNTPNQRVISDTSATAPNIMSGISSSTTSAKNLTAKAQDFFSYPNYEIWVYERYKDPNSGNNLVFIFGDNANSGDYELLDSLEDLIPSRAFNPSIGRSSNPTATPGILLQMLFYDQTAAVDSYFGNALMDLESEALSSTDADPYLGSAARSKNRFEMARIHVQAPRQTSTYAENIPEIEMNIHQYRLLDNENRPYYMTFVYSLPFKIIFSHLVGNSNSNAGNFELVHTAQLRDSNWELQTNTTHSPPLSIENQAKSVQTLFLLPYTGSDTEQLFGANLKNNSISIMPDSVEYMFSPQIIGLGKKIVSPPEPISPNPNQLEMGDLILGYSDYLENEHIPFYVPLQKQIPINKNLKLHFEVYHLKQNPSGISQFTVEYRVESAKRLGIFSKNDDSEVSLLLNYETDESFFKENLDISTRELEPGKYTLRIKVTDLVTNQEKNRQVDFEITRFAG